MALFDPAQLEVLEQGYQQSRLVRPPVSRPLPTRGRGGTLSSLISEGGALGGGAAGAAIGTGILPGVGTLVGGALGAGIGAFTGRVAENKVRDDRLGIGDAAKEGVLSAAFGSSPLVLGKAAFAAKKGGVGLAEALRAGSTKSTGMTVAKGASTSATPGRTSLSGKLDEMANKALTSQYGSIGQPVARATNPEKTFSQLSALGITKPSDVERISSAITGTGGILNKAVVKATGGSSRVDVSNLRQTLTDAMENNGVVGTKQKELITMFDAQMKRLLGGPKGSLDDTADPSDVLDVMKSFEKRIAQKSGKGSNYRLATDETTNQANALRLVVDELQGRLESGANVKNVLTPQLRQKLVSLHPKNEAWQKYVDNNIMRAKDIKSLRSAQSPFVNAKKIIDDADLNSMTIGGRQGNNANLSIREALMNAATKVANGPVMRTAASGLKAASKVTNNLSTTQSQIPTLPSGLKIGAKSQIGEGLASALLGGQSLSNSDKNLTLPSSSMTLMPLSEDLMTSTSSQTANTTTPNMMSGQPNPNTNQNTASAAMYNMSPLNQTSGDLSSSISNGDPFSVDNVQGNIQTILQNGGTVKEVQDYLSIASAIQSLRTNAAKTGGSGLNSTTATQVAASANATNTLDQLESLFNTAGGGAGKLGGTLKNALSRTGLDGNTQTYNDLSASSVSQLARALNGGGQVSDADAAVVIKALPRITDSTDVAARKFAALRARLQAARQNTLLYNGVAEPSGPTDLAAALGS